MKIRYIPLVLSLFGRSLFADKPTQTEEIQQAIDEAPVLSRKVIEGENRVVTVEEIEAPVIPKKEEAPIPLPSEVNFPPLAVPLPNFSLNPISATVVDGQYSHLTWTKNEERFEAWTNINFEYLRSVQNLETEEDHFHYILGVSYAQESNLTDNTGLGSPPVFDVTYPILLLVKGSIENHEGLAPLVALLDHYESHEFELLGANEELEVELAAR